MAHGSDWGAVAVQPRSVACTSCSCFTVTWTCGSADVGPDGDACCDCDKCGLVCGVRGLGGATDCAGCWEVAGVAAAGAGGESLQVGRGRASGPVAALSRRSLKIK